MVGEMMTEEEIRAFFSRLQEEGEEERDEVSRQAPGPAAGVKRSREPEIRRVRFPSLGPAADGRVKTGLSHLEDVKVTISAELGEATLKVREILNLQNGSLIKLDKTVGDYADLRINGKKFARGEVLVINDVFGVRINSINPSSYLKAMEADK